MKLVNKRASFDYELGEKFEAGIVLKGSEAKTVRLGGASLNHAYAKIMDGEVWLINANIPIEGKKDNDPTRIRKLLMHRDQITSIQTKIKAKNLTLVPVALYNRGRLYKLELALGKPKRKHEKREIIKARDTKRELERELKS